MIEFILLMIVLEVLTKIVVGEKECWTEVDAGVDATDNGTKEAFVLNNAWEFKSLDDCMEFRELRRSGWRGNAIDFYKWKEEE